MLCFRCGSYNPENAQKCSVCGQGFIDESGRVVGPPRRESKTTTPAAIFVPGEMVASRYRIGELLGQGGVGAVYRARDLEIDVDIALKGITPNLLQTEEEQKNFSKQIKGARKLQHPNIVRIYDEGHEGNRRFFTMKLLEGLTLRKIIRLRHEKGQPFTAEELVPIFHQLAAALDYAHKSTWHGDLKPENIIILPDLLKITDFNLVKALPLKPFLGIAKSRSKGFPYIAPELRVEAQNIDGRADTYALGVILGEMLTGMVFEGHYTRAMTAALEQLPTKLDGLVRRAVTEHPDGRFQRGSDLAKELETALGAMQGPLPAPARPATAPLSGAVTAPNPGQKPAQPNPYSTLPPPLPVADDTGPQGPPPPQLSSDDAADVLRDPSEILEIGQSQVLLLQSGVTESPPGVLAEAARRLMAAGSHPEDTLDEGSGSDAETAPRGAPLPKEMVVSPPRKGFLSTGERPQDPAKLVEALYNDERDDELIPPPLPDDQQDASDGGMNLPGDDAESDEGPTAEHPVLGKQRDDDSADLPRAHESQDGGTTDRVEDRRPRSSEIHDALTALKPHPPELMDDGPRKAMEAVSPGARATQTGDIASEKTDKVRERGRTLPPPIEDDENESIQETLSADVLRAAKERSSPSLHRADPLPPPVVAPPPVLRPVTPPRRASNSSGSTAVAAILGVVLVAAAVVIWRYLIPHDDKPARDHETDHALVTPGHAPVEAVVPPPVVVDAGTAVVDLKPAIDATKPLASTQGPVVDATKPDAIKPDATKPDATKPDAIKPDATKPDATKPDATKPDGAKVDDTKPETAPVVAMATGGTCPKGMIFIDGGSFSFGSEPGDPMRNFGEGTSTTVEVKPFCIDYYEQPNGKDALPTVGVSWAGAKSACDRLGRRLCSEKEWERACKGPSSARFPYGNTYDADTCNTEDASGKPRSLAPATAFKRCRSGYKVFMMAGNAEEWVADAVNGNKIAKGGAADRPDFSSRCAARRVPDKGQLGMVGFRCCAEAKQ